MAHLTKACPILPAADVAATAAWYRDKLGFELHLDHGDYAILVRDGIELHFWQCEDRNIAENSSVYLRVEDIDGMHAALSRASEGGRIAPVTDREWGMREFYVWDPNGNLLRFGVPSAARKIA
jgi:catechol 2,3-dioxygenase-like lactoylglutathione lyase family enzyme